MRPLDISATRQRSDLNLYAYFFNLLWSDWSRAVDYGPGITQAPPWTVLIHLFGMGRFGVLTSPQLINPYLLNQIELAQLSAQNETLALIAGIFLIIWGRGTAFLPGGTKRSAPALRGRHRGEPLPGQSRFSLSQMLRIISPS